MKKKDIKRNEFKSIKSEIAAGNLSRALERTIDICEELYLFTEEKNAIRLCHNHQNIHKECKILGALDYETYNRMSNKIIQELLELLDEVSKSIEALEEFQEVNYSSKEILNLIDVTKSYSDFKLKNIDLSVLSNEIIAVIGKNSAGKSTLLKIIGCKANYDSGQYNLVIKKSKFNYSKILNVGYMSQSPPAWVLPFKDVLALYARLGYSSDSDKIKSFVDKILVRYNLNSHLNKKWQELSGGYKTRFELARLVASNRPVLVLDEPLSFLDPEAQRIFLEDLRIHIKKPNENRVAIISSQNISEIERVADKVVFLENGKLRFFGPPDKLNEALFLNEYLCVSENSKKELLSVLSILSNDVRIVEREGYYKIKIRREFGMLDLMKVLSNSGLVISKIENISKSTRRFLDERDL